jgi:hypothetical protein
LAATVDLWDMGERGSEKTNPRGCGKLTAAHLAGIRPLPPPESPLGKWDVSTAFLAGFAFALLTIPELAVIAGAGNRAGAPHPSTDLLMVLAIIAVFGIFPVVFLQHHFLQNICQNPSRFTQVASVVVALAVMFFATTAMKPLVGYDQKLAENQSFQAHIAQAPVVGGVSRSPASASP